MFDAGSTRIFGYGSLLWNPGFDYEQKTPARLDGHHRAFCRLSVRHRGTPRKPGMVVGLKPGGRCDGACFAVSAAASESVLAYLDEREGAGYRRSLVEVRLQSATPAEATQDTGEAEDAPADPGRIVTAYTYLPEEGHPTYAPDLNEEQTVALIRDGVGHSGRAVDYLKELVAELRRLGIREPDFERMLARINGAAPI